MVKPLFSAVWVVDFIDNYLMNWHHDLCSALYNVMGKYIHINVFPPLAPPTSPNPHQPHLPPDPCSPDSISSTSIFTLSVRSHAGPVTGGSRGSYWTQGPPLWRAPLGPFNLRLFCLSSSLGGYFLPPERVYSQIIV